MTTHDMRAPMHEVPGHDFTRWIPIAVPLAAVIFTSLVFSGAWIVLSRP